MRTPTLGMVPLQDVSMQRNSRGGRRQPMPTFLFGDSEQHAKQTVKLTKQNKKLKTKCRNACRRDTRNKVTLKKLRAKPGKSRRLVAGLLGDCVEDLAKKGFVQIEQVRIGKKNRAQQSNAIEWAKRRAKQSTVRTLSTTRQSQLSTT